MSNGVQQTPVGAGASAPPDRSEVAAAHTPGPWEYVPSNEHHGPYVTTGADMTYGDIADCYVMSKPDSFSTRNGGVSYPIHLQPGCADANARLIAAAPDLHEALDWLLASLEAADRAVRGTALVDAIERLDLAKAAARSALAKAAPQ